ncbi:ABC transporter permease [Aquirufa sp.]|jgi:lipopolysaccharide transport system permease protein|uniref:ABC transporter permease n=1 Tax=Aquirufa sp. TaxID=2676249 RepID=UPI0037BE38B9
MKRKTNIENDEFDEIIGSDTKWFSINWLEIWSYKDLLFMFVKRDFVTFYKQTILGPLWFVFQPIIMTFTYVIIFGNIAGISTDGVPQFLFYLSGITLWSYFAESLNKVSTVFKDNANIFGKVYFPRLIMPLSIVVSGLIKLGIQFGIFLAVLTYYFLFQGNIHPNLWALAFPLLIFLLALQSLGLGMIISSMTTKYKDLVFLVTFGIQLFMFLTPVIYPSSILPTNFKFIFELNPLTGIFECFRYGLLGAGAFRPLMLLYSSISSLGILLIGTLIYNKVEKDFMDTV